MIRRAVLMLCAAVALAPAGCSALTRDSGAFEVFVAGHDRQAIDTLSLEVREDAGTVATRSIGLPDFAGSFGFESAPMGEYAVKVVGRAGAAVLLEAPTAPISIPRDGTSAIWVQLHAQPFEDDDGDLVRNGEDPCPLLANEAAGDSDGDGMADACDVCPQISNPSQADSDLDGQGDACETPAPGEPQPFGPVRDLFAARCALAACHGSLAPQAELDLSATASHAETVGVPSTQAPTLDRVESGDAAASYLYRKIAGGSFSEGVAMPPAPLDPLSTDEVSLIERWITDGAIP